MALKETRKQTKRKHVTPEEYKRIKDVLRLGLKRSQVSDIAERSYGTIFNIDESTSFEDFRNKTNQQKAKRAAVIVEPVNAENPIQQNLHFTREQKADPTLERIAVALERLANALEASPERKPSGFFGRK